jgi:hypothetical protein
MGPGIAWSRGFSRILSATSLARPVPGPFTCQHIQDATVLYVVSGAEIDTLATWCGLDEFCLAAKTNSAINFLHLTFMAGRTDAVTNRIIIVHLRIGSAKFDLAPGADIFCRHYLVPLGTIKPS